MRLTLLLFLCIIFGPSIFAQQKITVQVDNIKEDKGRIYMGLFRPNDAWLDPEGDAIGIVIPVEEKAASYVFEVEEAGEYAISIFHDINESGKMDFNFIGFPLEPFGFSNNPRILFSAPTFEECKFLVEDEDVKIAIPLKFFY